MICPTFAIYKAKLESNFQIQNKTKQNKKKERLKTVVTILKPLLQNEMVFLSISQVIRLIKNCNTLAHSLKQLGCSIPFLSLILQLNIVRKFLSSVSTIFCYVLVLRIIL